MAAWTPYADLNPKIPLLQEAVKDGEVTVYVLPRGTGGSHNLVAPRHLYVSRGTLNRHDDFATAVEMNLTRQP